MSMTPEQIGALAIECGISIPLYGYVDQLAAYTAAVEAAAKVEVAELTEKLAAQQALFVEMGKHPDNPSLYAMYMCQRNYYNDNAPIDFMQSRGFLI